MPSASQRTDPARKATASLSAAGRLGNPGFWLYALHLWSIFGIALSNLFIALTAVVSPWTVAWRTVDWRGLRPIMAPLALYTLLTVASVAASDQLGASVVALGEVSSLAALFFAPLVIRGERQVRLVVDVLLVLCGIAAVLGLSQFLFGYGGIDSRIRGPFSHYMTFAGVLLMAHLMLVAELVGGRVPRTWWRWLVLAALTVALLASLTRSAWVGLFFGLTLLLAIRAPRWLLAYVPAALIFVLLAPVPMIERVGSIADLGDESNYDRLCMIEAGLHMIAERPLLGIGPEMIDRRYAIYRHPSATRPWVPHLHNSYLSLAAERGLLALAAMMWILCAGVGRGLGMYRREGGASGPRNDLLLGSALAVVSFAVAGIFEDNWNDSEVQRMVLFLVALPFCLGSESDDARV